MIGSVVAGALGAPEWLRASCRKIGVLARVLGAGALSAALLVEPAVAGPMQLDGSFAVGSGGSATYNIPIAVPPGTAGMVPNLSLDYDSGRGSGIVGVGWALNGFSAIRRCPQTLAQDNARGRIGYDAADRYCFDGSRLMVVSGAHGADLSEYRTEIESFAKVIAHGTASNGPSWFEVRLPTGRVMELGNTVDSKILAKGKTSVRVWAVNKITDTKGNYLTFTYNNDTTNGSYYPTRIDYTGHTSPTVAPYASVQFSYVTRAAGDQVATYTAGSTTKLVQQLSEIKTYTGGTQVLSYKLTYEATANSATGVPRLASVQMCDPANLCQPATTFTWSNAANATVTYPTWGDWVTAPGNVNSSKPVPDRVGGLAPYVPGQPARYGGGWRSGLQTPNSRPGLGEIGGGDGDINGDGLADVLINNNGALSVTLSTGTGFTAPAATGITTNSPQLFDVFATGKPDVIGINNSNQLVRYANNGAGGFNTTPQVLTSVATHPVFPDIYTPMFSDLDGDSRPDMVWHSLPNQFFRNMNTGTGFSAAQAIVPPAKVSGQICTSRFVCQTVHGATTMQFANLSGRGNVDLVFTFQSVVGRTCNVHDVCTNYGTASQPGPWEVWYALWNGSGYSAAVQVLSVMHSNDSQTCGGGQNQQTCPNNFPVLSTRIADINGDGLSDLFISYPETQNWAGANIPAGNLLYVGNGNGVNSSVAPGFSATSCDQGLQFRDLYGSGRTDAFCVDGTAIRIARPNTAGTAFGSLGSLATAPDENEWWTKDFNGDGYLDILLQDDNNHYRVALSQRVGGAPGDLLTGVAAGLGSTIAIAYETPSKGGASFYAKGTAGVYPRLDIAPTDYVVKQVDHSNGIGGQFSSAYKYGGAQFETTGRGLTGFGTKIAKDLGTNIETVTVYRRLYPYVGMVSSEVKSLGAVTLSSIVNTQSATSLGGTRYFPFTQSSVLTSADLDGTALPSMTTSYSYDAFGNPTVVTETASDGYSTSTTNAYTNDTTRWILGQMTQSQVGKTAPSGTLTRTTTFVNDPNSGLMTQSVVEPSNPLFRVQTDFGYDAFGNWTSKTVSGAGIVSRTDGATYEPNGRFATTLTNPLSHVTTQGFSNAFGDLISVTDPNAVVATTTLDTWGRKILVTNSDGTKVSYQYQFCSGVAGGTATCPTHGAYRIYATPLAADGTTQIGAISITFFDRLEREIAKHVEGFDAAQPTRVTTQYDTLGRVLKTSRPYFVVSAPPKWTTFTYDALDRVTLETRPDASTIQHAYHGLSVTDTNQLSQVQTVVKNSRGEIVSVTDNLTHTTTFAYDPFGNLKTTTDSVGNVISNTYDLYGRKTAMSDPDMGNWSYGYDVLGQLTSQTSAKGQTVTLTYDKLGRMTGRTEPDLTSAWTYDTQTKGIGKLATTSSANFLRTVSYDVKGRPTQSVVNADGTNYTTTSTYNAQGKIGTVTYPSGFGLTYNFNPRGYVTSVTDSVSSLAYWTGNAYDAEGRPTNVTFGNGVTTTKTYNLDTGRIATIKAGPSDSVQNFTFTFNTLGNLGQMVDAVTQTTDTLAYDGLNRLNAVTTTNPSISLSGSKSVTYDAIGNITAKSDVGTYTYHPSRVHAVASIAPGATGTVTASYSYDANGNLLSGRGKTVAWTSFDMVSQITQGANVLNFTYDSERNRLKQTSSDGSTKYYLNDPISGIMQEKVIGASLAVSWNDYIMVGGEMVALHVTQASPTTRYFHKDHLGSITALTNEAGSVVERNSFDAWGERRVPTGLDDPLYPALSLTSQITRGYTGHEQLDAVGLVHMNGRIYDPIIGKMMSPDPTVPDPVNQQAYNRYAYVLNNPLSLTDPTGFEYTDKDERGRPQGEPAHKATKFESHRDWKDAKELSRFFGPITTPAQLNAARAIVSELAADAGDVDSDFPSLRIRDHLPNLDLNAENPLGIPSIRDRLLGFGPYGIGLLNDPVAAAPDYIEFSFSLNTPIPGLSWNGSVTFTQYGQVYGNFMGTGLGLGGGPSITAMDVVVANGVPLSDEPSPELLDNFLQGNATTVAGGYIAGAQVDFNKVGIATGGGLMTPQAGVQTTVNVPLGNWGPSWYE